MGRKCVLGFMLVSLGVLVLLSGCAGTKSTIKVPVQTVLEKMPDMSRPDWAESNSKFWVETGNYYSRGYVGDSAELQSSIDEAKASAQTELLEQIKNSIKTDFQKLMETQKYTPQTGEYVNKIFAEIVSKITIPYLSSREPYSEKVKEVFNKKQRIFYRSYVLLEFTKDGYEMIFRKVFADSKKEVKTNKDARKLVGTLEIKYLGKLGK